VTEKIKRYSKRGEQTYFSGEWVKYEDHVKYIDFLRDAAIMRDGNQHEWDCKFLRRMALPPTHVLADTREVEKVYCNCGHYKLGQAIREVT